METKLEMKIDAMEDRLGGIEEKMDKIFTLLSGNPINKNDSGYVGRVDKLESDIIALRKAHDERITKLERWNAKVFYIALGISFGAGWGFSDILKAIFFKH